MYKYQTVAHTIKEKIDAGIYKSGEQIPTEQEMIRLFGVSRQSVRRAIQYLESLGLLKSVQGSGTFVTENTGSPSNKIALILTNCEDHIFPAIIHGMHNILEESGYIINLFVTDNKVSKEYNILKTIEDKNYAGILLSSTRGILPRARDQKIDSLLSKTPCIMLDSYYPGYNLPYIAIDDERGGYMATEYLINNGHKKIAYIGRADYMQSILRYKGYTKALLENEIEPDDDRILFYLLNQYKYVFQPPLCERLLEILKDCTAVFCFNDEVACDLIVFLEQHGIHVPDDISVMGYDGMPYPGTMTKISSINHPKELLGKKAAQNIIKLIENPKFDAGYRFAPKLIPGETVIHL